VEFLSRAVEEQLNDRLKRFMETKNYDDNDVVAAREHVEACSILNSIHITFT
jgi:hypothetical protein